MRKNHKRNFTLKVYKAGVVQRYETSSLRRFLNHTRSLNWQKSIKKVYLRVHSGKFIEQSGKVTNLYNDGEYNNEQDFQLAMRAFLEK